MTDDWRLTTWWVLVNSQLGKIQNSKFEIQNSIAENKSSISPHIIQLLVAALCTLRPTTTYMTYIHTDIHTYIHIHNLHSQITRCSPLLSDNTVAFEFFACCCGWPPVSWKRLTWKVDWNVTCCMYVMYVCTLLTIRSIFHEKMVLSCGQLSLFWLESVVKLVLFRPPGWHHAC